MPRIHSANPDFQRVDTPTRDPAYRHGLDERKQFIPVAFQVTSPFTGLSLLPHALVMHVNPSTFNESNTKKVERIQTRGGFVEQHWPDDLDEISADGSTGAFMNAFTGTASIMRQRTIAWDRFRDLYDLYRNNGSVYDPYGNVVLQGDVRLMYDRGTYLGYFRQFQFEETEDSPFAFHVSWSFKVTRTILKLPLIESNMEIAMSMMRSPRFQGDNTLQTKALGADGEGTPIEMPTAGVQKQSVAGSTFDLEADLAAAGFEGVPKSVPTPKKSIPTTTKK